MRPFPTSWNQEQRQRFAQLKPLFGEGLVDGFACVHVAGTNGKGSVCAFMDSILRRAGYRTGLFTSPHLYLENERIRINGVPIPQDRLEGLVQQAYEIKPDCKVFETYFYAAVRWFSEQQVDIAIMETGIGGAMDATSILQPMLTAVTTVGLDHVAVLGNDFAEIARQKAGIAKPDVPMVLYPKLEQSAHRAALDTCAAIGAPVVDTAQAPVSYTRTRKGHRIVLPEIGVDTEICLLGEHQVYNAVTAAYMAHTMGISAEVIAQGLSQARWPGRLEWIADTPPTLLDGAHNPEGAMALRRAAESYIQGDIVLLTAMMADKDVHGVVSVLAPMAKQVVCTCVDPERGMPPQELAALYGEKAIACQDPKEAYRMAKALCAQDKTMVICGSLYLPSMIGWKETT